MVPEFSMFLGFFSAIVLDWTNPTQQKIAKVINFHPILTKILVSVFYTVKSAHLNSPIFKRNFLAIYKGNTQIFLLHRVQQVSKYLLSRLHKGSDRFLKNQGPTGGDPFQMLFLKIQWLPVKSDWTIRFAFSRRFIIRFNRKSMCFSEKAFENFGAW